MRGRRSFTCIKANRSSSEEIVLSTMNDIPRHKLPAENTIPFSRKTPALRRKKTVDHHGSFLESIETAPRRSSPIRKQSCVAVNPPSFRLPVGPASSDEAAKTKEKSMKSRFKACMHRLGELSLVSKFLILVLLPIALLFLLVMYKAVHSIRYSREASDVIVYVDTARTIADLATRLHLEQGYALLYVYRDYRGSQAAEWFRANLTAAASYVDAGIDDFFQLEEKYGDKLRTLFAVEEYDHFRTFLYTIRLHRQLQENEELDVDAIQRFYSEFRQAIVRAIRMGRLTDLSGQAIQVIEALMLQYSISDAYQAGCVGAVRVGYEQRFERPDLYILYLEAIGRLQTLEEQLMFMPEFEIIRDLWYSVEMQTLTQYFFSFHKPLLEGPLPSDPERWRISLALGCGALIKWDGMLGRQERLLYDHLFAVVTSEEETAQDDLFMGILLICLTVVVTVILVTLLILSIVHIQRKLQSEVDLRKKTESIIYRFFPKEFMHLLNRTDILSIDAGLRRKVEMTVLFCKVENFAHVNSILEPEEMYDWLTNLVGALIPVVSQYSGFMDKTLGDGLMVLFMDPSAAMNAALDMLKMTKQLNLDYALEGLPDYDLRLAVHTGDVIIGIIGDENRLEGTTVADTVNTASRAQGLCKVYGSSLIVSEDTFQRVCLEGLPYRSLGAVRLKGKHRNLQVYDVFATETGLFRETKVKMTELYERSLQMYQEGLFLDSIEQAEDALRALPEVTDVGLQQRIWQANQRLEEGSETLLESEWDGEDILQRK